MASQADALFRLTYASMNGFFNEPVEVPFRQHRFKCRHLDAGADSGAGRRSQM